MASISNTDNLFISASSMGHQFYNYTGCGISSISEIIRSVRDLPCQPRGMITITVRNASKGWAQTQALYL